MITNRDKPEAYRPGKEGQGFFYGYIIVIFATLVMLLAYGSRLSFGVFFKPMTAEFGWSRALTSGAVTFSMVMQGLWGVVMGRFNDRFGPRFIMTLCCFLIGVGFLLMSLTNHLWQLYLFYGFFAGIGGGGVFVALLSTVARWFVRKRAFMTGIVLTGIGLGTFFVPPLTTWLISLYDWRLSYVIIGGLVLTIGIVAAQYLKRDPSQMGLVPYGQREVERLEPTPTAGGLTLHEAVATRQFWMVAAIFAFVGYCIFAVSIHLVPHITDMGITPATAANVLAITGGVQAVSGIIMGYLADRIGSRWVLGIGLVLMSAALFWLVPVREIGMLYLFAATYGISVGASGTMEPIIVADLFGIKSHGFILGVVSLSFTIGGAIGPFVTGYLFDLTGSYRLAFLICALLAFTAIVLVALLRSRFHSPSVATSQ